MEEVLIGRQADGVARITLNRPEAKNSLLMVLFASEDQNEGMRAFPEKRKPIFQGR